MKKGIIIFLLLSSVSIGQGLKFGQARGLFMSVAGGPKIPIFEFSDKFNIGVGFDVAVSYTDNELLPVFLYAKIGYQHYPGRQNLYKKSDYSSISSNVILVHPGIKFFFPAVIEDIVILMPVIEAGLSFAYFENAHQFKIGSGKNNFVEEVSKFGFHAGAGFSMFLLDVMGNYNYFKHNQFLSFEFRLRIPIFVTI